MPVVTLQPDEAASKDTYINSGVPDNNFGTSASMSTGFGNPNIQRALLQFDLSGIPTGSVINSAVLTLVAITHSATNNVSIHRMLTEWYEGNVANATPTAPGSTWNKRDGFNNVDWAGGSGMGSGTDYTSTAIQTVSVTGTGSYSWTLTSEVNAMVNSGVTNNGWLLIGGSSNAWRSSGTGTTADRPKLVIDYTYDDPTDSITGAAAAAATATGILSLRGLLHGTANSVATASGTMRGIFGSKTTVYAQDLLRLIFHAEPISGLADVGADPILNLYVSLHTGALDEDSTQETNESTYSGYARVAVPRTADDWVLDGTSVYNAEAVEFPVAGADDAPITYVAIGTAATGAGKTLYYTEAFVPLNILETYTPRIEIGNLRVGEG